MAEWKKIVVSGSAISQLNNDAGYVTSIGSSIASASHVADGVKSGSISGDTLSLHQFDGGRLDIAMGGITPTTADTASYVAGARVDGDIAGKAGSATVLATARTIGGVSFNGSANINLPGVNSAGNQNTSGNAATATTASHATTALGSGVSGTVANATSASRAVSAASADTADTALAIEGGNVDGAVASATSASHAETADTALSIAGSEVSGTVGSATSASHAEVADALATARTIGGVSFDGSANINLPGVNSAGNQNTSGNAATATTASHATTALGSGVSGTVASATSASHAETADALSASATGTNLTLSGDLVINGSTTTVSTTNLEVEDRFVFLNDGGGGTAVEGGIIVESGTADSGEAFFYDGGTSRWAFAEGISKTATAVTPLAFMGIAYLGTTAAADDANLNKAGVIAVDGADIYIRDNA